MPGRYVGAGVKDAYAVWLRELEEDDPAKVVAALSKSNGRRRRTHAERNEQFEHAQQPTAASALKRSSPVDVDVDEQVGGRF